MNKKKTRINLILEIILWLVSIVTIYPMLMVLLTSFKNKGEAAYMNISLPSEWHPENYITVLEKDFYAFSREQCVYHLYISGTDRFSFCILKLYHCTKRYKRMQDRV